MIFQEILIFQEFRYLARLHRWCPTRVGGGRRSPGIGPQGRQSAPQHSAHVGDIVGIDPDGPESPQVTLNEFHEISRFWSNICRYTKSAHITLYI